MFTSSPNLADHCRRLIEAVTDALRPQGGRGVFAGPAALLIWLRTRRLRKEAQAWQEQFKMLMEQLLVLLEQFRAGTLNTPTPAGEANGSIPPAAPLVIPAKRRGKKSADSQDGSVSRAAAPDRSPASPPGSRRDDEIGNETKYIPSFRRKPESSSCRLMAAANWPAIAAVAPGADAACGEAAKGAAVAWALCARSQKSDTGPLADYRAQFVTN